MQNPAQIIRYRSWADVHWLRSRLGAAWQATGAFGLRPPRFVTARSVLRSAEAWVQWLRKRGKAQFSAPLGMNTFATCSSASHVAVRWWPCAVPRSCWPPGAGCEFMLLRAPGRERGASPTSLRACLPLPSTCCATLSPQAKRAPRRAQRRRRRMVRGPGSGEDAWSSVSSLAALSASTFIAPPAGNKTFQHSWDIAGGGPPPQSCSMALHCSKSIRTMSRPGRVMLSQGQTAQQQMKHEHLSKIKAHVWSRRR